MSVLSTIRLSLWGTTIFFTLIVLSLSAHVISLEVANANEVNNNYYGDYGYGYTNIPTYSTWTAMAIATSGLTLLTLPVYMGIDMGRTGAFTSMIAVEMATTTLLWIFWVTTAALTVESPAAIFANASSCVSDGGCSEVKAIEAFSFLNSFTLLGYFFLLLVFTLIAHNRGHSRVWLQSVKETNFFAPPVTPPPGEKAMPAMAAPQPQYQYPPNFGTPGPVFSSSPPPQGMPYGQPMQQQPVYPQYAGSPVMQQQQPMYPQHTGSPVMQQQQQPMYPQYAGSPVMQQNPGLPGQAGYGQV